jgi:hypothetical protein
MADPKVAGSVEALEDLLEKSTKLLHPQNHVVNLIRFLGHQCDRGSML